MVRWYTEKEEGTVTYCAIDPAWAVMAESCLVDIVLLLKQFAAMVSMSFHHSLYFCRTELVIAFACSGLKWKREEKKDKILVQVSIALCYLQGTSDQFQFNFLIFSKMVSSTVASIAAKQTQTDTVAAPLFFVSEFRIQENTFSHPAMMVNCYIFAISATTMNFPF